MKPLLLRHPSNSAGIIEERHICGKFKAKLIIQLIPKNHFARLLPSAQPVTDELEDNLGFPTLIFDIRRFLEFEDLINNHLYILNHSLCYEIQTEN